MSTTKLVMINNNNNNNTKKFMENSATTDFDPKLRYISYKPKNGHLEGKTIADFYKGTSIFVTGITGFVGKTLLEKLLRSCEGITKIYALVRSKRGVLSGDRLDNIFNSPAFDFIKENKPELFSKVIVIDGDCAEENLGITEDDRKELIENVDIVFHSAASVRFNEPLQDAINLNTYGTKMILELCKQMKKIKSFVYVSTAFSNSDRVGQEIEEIVYKPKYGAEGIISCVKTLTPEIIQEIEQKIIGGHPNTYTFSKALAEDIVLQYSSSITTAIVRPSIVTASVKEPLPGWTDSKTGATGVVSEIGRGGLGSVLCKDSNRVDIIPVDILVNTLITAAWHNYHNRSKNLRVYNCTTGKWKPVTWKIFSHYAEKYSKEYPSKYLLWYPSVRLTINRRLNWFFQMYVNHLLIALINWHCNIMGKKNLKVLFYYRKLVTLLGYLDFFTTNEFEFAQENAKALAKEVSKDPDGAQYNSDLSGFDIKEYMKNYILGIRLYLYKDDLSSLPKAKNTLNKIYWFRIIFQILVYYIVFSVITYLFGLKVWPLR